MPSPKSYTGYVYLIGSTRYGWFKIGKSCSPEIRVNAIGVMLPFKIDLYALWGTNNHSLMESAFHRTHAEHRINGEWFRFSPETLKRIISDYPPYIEQRLWSVDECVV